MPADRKESFLDYSGVTLTLLTPLFLTHGRALAEISMSAIAVLFLLRCFMRHDWSWLREAWVQAALVWWGWQLFCTLPFVGMTGTAAMVQATLTIRIIVFIAALQKWTLQNAATRLAMKWILSVCAVYIATQVLFQAYFGVNFFGYPRSADGTLTGPYAHSRAAAPLSRLALPVLMLVLSTRAMQSYRWRHVLGLLLSILVIGTVALAGQRTPMALTLFGVVICAILYKAYRFSGLLSAVSAPAILYAVKLVSHRSTDHLVTLTQQQLSRFAESHYGLIYGRAWAMVSAHPFTGLGYDAFRDECRNPVFFKGLTSLGQPADGGGAAICVQHAHNHYAQMLSNSGWPGLLTFVVMVGAIAVALWPRPGVNIAWRTGLFVAFVLQEWPIASTSDFINLPLAGWAFLMIGIGLAEACNARREAATLTPRDQEPSTKVGRA